MEDWHQVFERCLQIRTGEKEEANVDPSAQDLKEAVTIIVTWNR
jgi:hypothetical protein